MNTMLPKMLVAGPYGVVALTVEGKILTAIHDYYKEIEAIKSDDDDLVIELNTGADYVAAYTAKNTVIGVGTDDAADVGVEIVTFEGNLKKIECGFRNAFAIQEDNTVLAAGDNQFGQKEVSKWKDIVDIISDTSRTIGLRKDGTVVACGYCDEGSLDVEDWTDICGIACGYDNTFGIKKDGTVVATGNNEAGQCNVSEWTDIVKVVSSYSHTVGLKKDGTVVACGANNIYESSIGGPCDVAEWSNVIEIYCDSDFTLGLRSDGKVLFTGNTKETAYYKGIGDVIHWDNIAHIIPTGVNIYGIKKDGSVCCCGNDYYNLSGWKLFDNLETIDEDFRINLEKRKHDLVVKERINKKVCVHCGGEFKGLFTKTCAACGRKKDY